MSKTVHLAAKISPVGDVSPLCATVPKKIDLNKESWTNREEAVTCQKCKSKLMESK